MTENNRNSGDEKTQSSVGSRVTGQPDVGLKGDDSEPTSETTNAPRDATKTDNIDANRSSRTFFEACLAACLGLFQRPVLAIALFIVAVFSVGIIYDIMQNNVLVYRIDVPRSVSQEGFTPEVFASKLIDGVSKIREASDSVREKQGGALLPEWKEPDLEVPGTKLSFRSLINHVIRIVQLPHTHISGEITEAGYQFELTLRMTDENQSVSWSHKETSVPKLVDLGAREIEKFINPFTLAHYFYSFLGEKEAALEVIDYCLKNDPPDDDVWALNLWGAILFATDADLENAIEKFEEALRIEANFAPALNNWGIVCRIQNEFECAIDKYERAIDARPNFKQAHINKGAAQHMLGRYRDAIKSYQAALQIDRNFEKAYVNWGEALSALEDYPEAIKKYEKAIEIRPDYANAYVSLGEALSSHGDYSEAIRKFERAIEIKPGYLNAYVSWGKTLSVQGQCEEAIEKLDSAITLDPENNEAINIRNSCAKKRELATQTVTQSPPN